MKKTIVILLLFLAAFNLRAQDGNLEKQTYIRAGYSFPTWRYFGYSGKSDWEANVPKRSGFLLEFGNIFMLNSLKIGPGMRLGINIDYLSLNYNKLYFKDAGIRDHFAFVGSKIGPSFSFCPVQRLTFDTYFKINPIWVAVNAEVSEDEGTEDLLWIGFMGLKYSLGLNVRYSILMLGFEFNPGFARLREYDNDENKLTKVFRGNPGSNKERTTVPSMNFTLGLSF